MIAPGNRLPDFCLLGQQLRPNVSGACHSTTDYNALDMER
jgi:hypothetical protein